jgi:hypothetical protein
VTVLRNFGWTLAGIALGAPSCLGGLPPLGGPMNHVLVTLDASGRFSLSVEEPGTLELIEPDALFTGPASVLNGTRFNAQHGWLVSGLWAPPAGTFVRIETIEVDPGLRFYAGRSFGSVVFMQPLHGTDGADAGFAWDGVMLHNYAAVSSPGVYEATFRVSIRDGAGEMVDGFEAGEISLSWVWTPDCAADLAEPYGVLDLSDIASFVSAFVAGEPAADIASPGGVFDLNDIAAFVDAFVGGCP